MVQGEKNFSFYELPQRVANIQPIGEKREFIDQDTGEVYKYSYQELVSIVGKESADIMWGEQK